MRRIRVRGPLVALTVFLLGAPLALAQSGPITLTVDATQVARKIVRTTMVMPVKPGPVTLYYPKWIPGEHAASGPIANVTGLKFTANGKTIPWTRDLLDGFTFHVDVPSGADRLEVSFDYLEPGGGAFTAGASATDKLVVVSWNQNLLYPAGTPAQQLSYAATLVLPPGWKFGTPLPVASQSADRVTFTPVALNRLVDSPVVAGEYYRAIDITPPGEPIHHEIDIVADSQDALDMSPEVKQGMTNLVAEAGKLFGVRHYRDYHFLLTLSDHVAHFGLEHHESNDSRLPERTLLEPNAAIALGGLLAHEYAHSWNGKFRRPADLEYALLRGAREDRPALGVPGVHRLRRAAARHAQRAVDARGVPQLPGGHRGLARPGPPRAHLAPAAGHGHGRALRQRPRRLLQLAPRHRLLRRRRPALARGGHDHPRPDARPEVHRRLLPPLLRRPQRRPPAEDLHVRRRGEGAERRGAVRLGGVLRHAPDVHVGRRADRRHRERRLEGRLHEPAAVDARPEADPGRRVPRSASSSDATAR